ncbi:type II CRISPR-associated endonuclease Cas1 [Agrilactobacillus yilanensis]|uniref:CRISPR-associated endonuclease Cas1 n=1 Tax=Agrilactobacillus yilanensis TaxID=2485997 RepID=A0ABW4JA47_9LACO|nr:type II CRISPR-associated endonuclease Cas1 [Agrilactobacillus yilanensis]
MAFRTVVITKHCKINYKLGQVVIRTDEDVFQVPIDDIRILMIATTQSVITSYCVMALLQANIKIIFGDDKGFPIGEINGYGGNNARNRNINIQIGWPDTRKNQIWQKIVKCKITQQQAVLDNFNLKTEGFAELVASVDLGDANNREAVAAKMYFPRLFGKGFARKDADNLINGHLNYGYQILLAEMARNIHEMGYLTELGIHHISLTNEYNLACDLVEIFRPLVDYQVYQQQESALELEQKLNLVDLLNKTITFNGHEALVTSAMMECLRNTLDFLSGKVDVLPEWGMKQ